MKKLLTILSPLLLFCNSFSQNCVDEICVKDNLQVKENTKTILSFSLKITVYNNSKVDYYYLKGSDQKLIGKVIFNEQMKNGSQLLRRSVLLGEKNTFGLSQGDSIITIPKKDSLIFIFDFIGNKPTEFKKSNLIIDELIFNSKADAFKMLGENKYLDKYSNYVKRINYNIWVDKKKIKHQIKICYPSYRE